MPNGFMEERFLVDPFLQGVSGIWTKQVKSLDSNSLGFMQHRFMRDPFLNAAASQWTKRTREVETL